MTSPVLKNITIGADEKVDSCEEFCYLRSTIDREGGSDREIMIRLGKANGAFGRLWKIWACKRISVSVKVKLYSSLVLSVLLHGAETWPMSKRITNNLEAAHHRWLRKIVHVTWRDRVTNEKVRELTQQGKLETLSENAG